MTTTFRQLCQSFLDNGLIKDMIRLKQLLLKIQKLENYMKIDLKPQVHGCLPLTSTGAIGHFSYVRISYNGFVTNDTEVLHCINLDELITMASKNIFLNPNKNSLEQSKSV